MCSSLSDTLFSSLIYRDSSDQFTYTNMLLLPVKIQIHQTHELQISLPSLLEYQTDKTNKLFTRFIVSIGCRTDQTELFVNRNNGIIKYGTKSLHCTETVCQRDKFMI